MVDVFADPEVQAEVAPVEVQDATPPEEETAPSEVESKPEPEVKPERVFTQKELDEILQKRLAKESRKIERYSRAEAELRVLKEQMQPKAEPVNHGEPKPEQFKDYESYIEAVTDWKVEQKFKGFQAQSEQERQRQEQAQHEAKLRDNLNKAAAKYEDFEDVVTNPEIPITLAMRDAIGESDIGGDIAYHLGTNVQEAVRIANLSPIAQVRAILDLESKLKAPKKVTTDAPAPIVPNAGKGKVAKDPGQMTDAEYAKWRRSGRA